MSIGAGSGCDEDGVMPVGSSASFVFLEIVTFSCTAGLSKMVCDEDSVISIGVSAASTFLFFLLSLALWIVPSGVSLLTPSCSLLTGPANGVLGGEVLELMVDQCYGMDYEGERAKRLYTMCGYHVRCEEFMYLRNSKAGAGRARGGILIPKNRV